MASSHEENHENTSKEENDPGPKGLEQYRTTAQQNAIEAIRAAEERYAKAKESGSEAASKSKESAGHVLGAAGSKLREIKERSGALAADVVSGAAEKSRQVKDCVSEKAGSVKETANKAADYAGKKASETKQKVGEQTKATQEKLKAVVIGGKDEEEERKGGKEEEEKEGKDKLEMHPQLEQACKATRAREKGEKERCVSQTTQGGKEDEDDCEAKEEGARREGRVKLVRVERARGGGILQAVGETVVGIMQTARDMIVGKD